MVQFRNLYNDVSSEKYTLYLYITFYISFKVHNHFDEDLPCSCRFVNAYRRNFSQKTTNYMMLVYAYLLEWSTTNFDPSNYCHVKNSPKHFSLSIFLLKQVDKKGIAWSYFKVDNRNQIISKTSISRANWHNYIPFIFIKAWYQHI